MVSPSISDAAVMAVCGGGCCSTFSVMTVCGGGCCSTFSVMAVCGGGCCSTISVVRAGALPTWLLQTRNELGVPEGEGRHLSVDSSGAQQVAKGDRSAGVRIETSVDLPARLLYEVMTDPHLNATGSSGTEYQVPAVWCCCWLVVGVWCCCCVLCAVCCVLAGGAGGWWCWLVVLVAGGWRLLLLCAVCCVLAGGWWLASAAAAAAVCWLVVLLAGGAVCCVLLLLLCAAESGVVQVVCKLDPALKGLLRLAHSKVLSCCVAHELRLTGVDQDSPVCGSGFCSGRVHGAVPRLLGVCIQLGESRFSRRRKQHTGSLTAH